MDYTMEYYGVRCEQCLRAVKMRSTLRRMNEILNQKDRWDWGFMFEVSKMPIEVQRFFRSILTYYFT